MSQFNLEKQYQFYLEKVDLTEEKMSPTQRIETRRAFMGACGIMLVCIHDAALHMDFDQLIEIYDNMVDQVGDFWKKENIKES